MVVPASLFDNLPPIISDPAHSTPIQNNQHQFLFQPIGKYATDVHYSHIRLPIYFKPILQSIYNISIYMIDIFSESKTHATNLVIQEITNFNQIHVDLIKQKFKNLIANLPSKPIANSNVEKHKTLELFGIAGTAFGIANSIAISHINSQLSKEIHRTNMLVDVTQLHHSGQIVELSLTVRTHCLLTGVSIKESVAVYAIVCTVY